MISEPWSLGAPPAFKWHCALDSAMTFFKRNPRITDSDKEALDTLHTYSVKMFGLFLETFGSFWGEEYAKYVKGRPEEGSVASDASSEQIDWCQVLEL
ncbi:hypothetical protein NLI96_g8187 [Meripilus lineatus]|uniref:Uncharacterized protein n=1 Tax=Meripilus lineatus TaxID=2056292 RepID=A0AAD5UXU5_9APHY|nr:hypothetical protein NLI96_g8187 [Physisporinus lineatus]